MKPELSWHLAKLANQWVLITRKPHRTVDGRTIHYKGSVMRLHPDYKLTPRKRIFLGWIVMLVDDAGFSTTQVGPRIWQLQKAKDFAEMIWRMNRG